MAEKRENYIKNKKKYLFICEGVKIRLWLIHLYHL